MSKCLGRGVGNPDMPYPVYHGDTSLQQRMFYLDPTLQKNDIPVISDAQNVTGPTRVITLLPNVTVYHTVVAPIVEVLRVAQMVQCFLRIEDG